MVRINYHGYVPLVVSTSWSFPHSCLITGFVTRLTRRMSLVEQELPTLPEHLRSPPVFIGVRVTRSLVLYVCFVNRCLCFCTFSFGHCFVCSSSIYGFWLHLWYLQTLLKYDTGHRTRTTLPLQKKINKKNSQHRKLIRWMHHIYATLISKLIQSTFVWMHFDTLLS